MIEDFYVKVKSKEEAAEVVNRAIANGAKLYEAPSSCGFAHRNFEDYHRWDLLGSWGVYNGRTFTFDIKKKPSYIKELTVEELRVIAPLGGEQFKSSDRDESLRKTVDLFNHLEGTNFTVEQAELFLKFLEYFNGEGGWVIKSVQRKINKR